LKPKAACSNILLICAYSSGIIYNSLGEVVYKNSALFPLSPFLLECISRFSDYIAAMECIIYPVLPPQSSPAGISNIERLRESLYYSHM
jgi:hypothetical protein